MKHLDLKIFGPRNKQDQGYSKILVVSGVNISKTDKCDLLDCPEKDYEVLFEVLQPDIIDTIKIKENQKPMIAWARHWLGLTWAVAIEAFQQTRKYEVIFATGEDVGLPLALLLKYTRLKIPLIVTCHNISSRSRVFFLKYLKAASAVHFFECLSNSQALMLGKYAGIADEKAHLLYWHVDHKYFKPMPDVPVRNQICSAGMASRDYATLVNAVEGLNINVKIAADSPWFRQKLNISAENLQPWVEMRSYGNYAALRHLYAESLFVVVPLLDVPYSAGYTVILEAMAMGKAVIVSRIKQKDDFIVDGWNGLYVTPGNKSELRQKICFLLEQPEKASRLGRNARKTVEDNFTLNHYVARIKQDIFDAMDSQG